MTHMRCRTQPNGMISNEFNSHQEKRRPIVLMDHSYGGIVIAHVRMSLPLVRAVFELTSALLVTGTHSFRLARRIQTYL